MALNWLEKIVFAFRAWSTAFTDLPARKGVLLGTGLTAVDDPLNDRIVVTANAAVNSTNTVKNPYGATGNGTSNDFNAIHTAFATEPDLRYPAGNYHIATSGTIGDVTSVHRFMAGGKLTHDPGVILTIRGQIDAARGQQIFDAGTNWILLPDVAEVDPGWFGAPRDGSGDATPGINAALVALAPGGRLDMSHGSWLCADTIVIANPARILLYDAIVTGQSLPMISSDGNNLTLEGSNRFQSQIIAPSAAGAMISLTGTFDPGGFPGGIGKAHIVWNRIGFHGDTNVTVGDFSSGLTFQDGLFVIEECYFKDFYQVTDGVFLKFDNAAVQFLRIISNSFYNCSSLFVGYNTDGLVRQCEFIAGVYGPAVIAEGPDLHIDDNIFAAQTLEATYPDLRIYPENSAATGFLWITNNKFGPENDGLNPDRCKIDINFPGNTALPVNNCKIRGNLFLGPNPLAIASITGTGTTATITIAAGPRDFAMSNGSTTEVWFDEILDGGSSPIPGYEGLHTITITSLTTATFASTETATAASGLLYHGSNSAIRQVNPCQRLEVVGNTFASYAFLIDDSSPLDISSGNNVFEDNHHIRQSTGPVLQVVPWKVFKNDGRFWARAIMPIGQPNSRGNTPTVRRTLLQNRIAYSSRPDQWTGTGTGTQTAGVTYTTGQTDPYGGTRAVKVTRDGAAYSQSIEPLIDASAASGGTLPTSLFGRFWAKAGSLRQVLVALIDGTSSEFAHFDTVQLTDDWAEYTIPFVGVVNPAHAYALLLYPGGLAPIAGDFYIFGIQVMDSLDRPYVPTDDGFYQYDTHSLDTDLLFRRMAGIKAAPRDQLLLPTITASNNGIVLGSSGVDAFSTDAWGSVILGTDVNPLNIMANGTVDITLGSAFGGPYNNGTGRVPMILVGLADAAGAWPDGSTVMHSASTYVSNQLTKFTFRWSTPAATLLSTSNGYRVVWQIVDR